MRISLNKRSLFVKPARIPHRSSCVLPPHRVKGSKRSGNRMRSRSHRGDRKLRHLSLPRSPRVTWQRQNLARVRPLAEKLRRHKGSSPSNQRLKATKASSHRRGSSRLRRLRRPKSRSNCNQSQCRRLEKSSAKNRVRGFNCLSRQQKIPQPMI